MKKIKALPSQNFQPEGSGRQQTVTQGLSKGSGDKGWRGRAKGREAIWPWAREPACRAVGSCEREDHPLGCRGLGVLKLREERVGKAPVVISRPPKGSGTP